MFPTDLIQLQKTWMYYVSLFISAHSPKSVILYFDVSLESIQLSLAIRMKPPILTFWNNNKFHSPPRKAGYENSGPPRGP